MSNNQERTSPTPEEEAGKQPEPQAEQSPKAGEEKAGLGKFIAMAMALKEKNPLAFYGGIGAFVLIVLGWLFFGGGGVEQAPMPTVQVGQTYQLVNPNVTGGGDVLLLQAPGRMGATDPELREKEQICVVQAGTPAKVLELTTVSYVKYAKVEPLAGECQGQAGWTSLVNLKSQ
ncbi:hypothetical protein JCM13664_05430 [Methylothermus subterraneus]